MLLQKFKQDLEVKQLATCEELNENYSMEAHSSLARYLINQMCSKGATDSVTLRDDKYGFVESEKKNIEKIHLLNCQILAAWFRRCQLNFFYMGNGENYFRSVGRQNNNNNPKFPGRHI